MKKDKPKKFSAEFESTELCNKFNAAIALKGKGNKVWFNEKAKEEVNKKKGTK